MKRHSERGWLIEVFSIVFWLAMAVIQLVGVLSGGVMQYVAAPFFLLCVAIVSLLLWGILQRAVLGRCPRCGASLVDSGTFALRHPRWCYECDRLLQPEDFRTAEGRWNLTLELEPPRYSDSAATWLKMLLWEAMENRSDQLVFEPSESDYRVFHTVDSNVIELEPPLAHHRRIVAISRAFWACDAYADEPATGKLDLIIEMGNFAEIRRCSATTIATFTPTDVGEIVCFSFAHHSQPQALSA